MVNMMINIKFEGQDFWVNFEFISSFLFFLTKDHVLSFGLLRIMVQWAKDINLL